MKTRAAVIRGRAGKGSPAKFEVTDVVLDRPVQGELLVKMAASGLCHSDYHLASGETNFAVYPVIGGHEGAGIVEETGPHTPGFKPGDHVVFSFLPACGRCRWCASGMQNLCDRAGSALNGSRPGSPDEFRVHLPDGTTVGQMCGLGTFSEHIVVSTDSTVKIDDDLPLDRACLLGCGVGTGWGAAVNSAAVAPGHTVIVMGIGGVGINAVQGAAHAGASCVVAVDRVAFKRQKALQFGATHAFASIGEADAFAKGRTNGQGADSVVITVGALQPEHVAQAFTAIRKAGVVVVTALGDPANATIPVGLHELTLFQKRIQGSLFGGMNPSWDIIQQTLMYRDGQLKLDELVSRTYTLDEINQGYEDMHAGKNLRGVITF